MLKGATAEYVDLGVCECGGTEFNVTAMVKSFASVTKNVESDNINVDDYDFIANIDTTEVDFETGFDLYPSRSFNTLPTRILDRVWAIKDSTEFIKAIKSYIVLRCSKCGMPFDYGDRQVVLGLED